MKPRRPARLASAPGGTVRRAGRRGVRAASATAALAAVLATTPGLSQAAPAQGAAPTPSSAQSARHPGDIPANFVGLSIEWSLIERYMQPSARPAFVRLLRNLGTGVLRIGGSSQDVTPFDEDVEDAANTNAVITRQDLTYLRDTLAAANAHTPRTDRPAWGVVLGTAMSPPSDKRPFVSPEYVHTFLTKGVTPVFKGSAARYIAGIELGNEPDLSYGSNGIDAYVNDLRTYTGADVVGHYPIIAPNTSEDILPWEQVDGQTVPTRFFWNWPRILDTGADRVKENAGAFGPYASDHFYPLARTCVNKPYRCPSTGALLSDEHMNSLDHQVYTHAGQAAERGLAYRLEETSTAANRGADGVSNVAASATYALDLMFHTACPQPPNRPGANADCGTGAVGVNFHNAEVRAFYFPEEGNAYYNAVNYDPTPAVGAPTAAPVYYAMLLFSRFAQGGRGLRPVTVTTGDSSGAAVKAWQLRGEHGEQRLFVINKGDRQSAVTLPVGARQAQVDRMTPYDPDGTGRTLDAPQVRIDGRSVPADGTWPGFHPQTHEVEDHQLSTVLAPGEAVVITWHGGP